MNGRDGGGETPHDKPKGVTVSHDATVINLDERQAAKFLGIGARTLWQLRKDGSVPYVKFGKSVRYPKPLLVKWLMEQATTSGNDRGESCEVAAALTASRMENGDLVNKTGM